MKTLDEYDPNVYDDAKFLIQHLDYPGVVSIILNKADWNNPNGLTCLRKLSNNYLLYKCF